MSDDEDVDNVEIPFEDDDPEGDEDDDALTEDNPIMQRIQDALAKQLSSANDRVASDLRNKEEENRRLKKKKEDVGVELYSVQQQLARVQDNVERSHDHSNVVTRQRQESETELEAVTQAYQGRRAQVEDLEVKWFRSQSELDQLNAALRQVEAFNEQMKSEIAVTRTATYKAEEAISKSEKSKRQQDIMIDNLNEQLKTTELQVAMYKNQLNAQQEQTAAAKATLQEAMVEMDAVNYEKKNLLNNWKGSLVAMSRRDETLLAKEVDIKKHDDDKINLDAEINGFKLSIKQAEETNERLTGTLHKAEAEEGFLRKAAEELRQKREQLTEKYALYKKSLEQTDAELQKANNDGSILTDELASVEKMTVKITQETQALEDQILTNVSQQTTLQKSSQNVAGAIQKTQATVRQTQIQAGSLENELARIRVDSLNTLAHNTKLEETLEELLDDLKAKETIIHKYELDIRKRNDEIAKKQHEVDRLNRRLDDLLSNMEDENTGPLEATIKSLTREIASLEEENAAMRRGWLKQQTELVGLENEFQNQSENINELESQFTILDEKRRRINRDIKEATVDVHELAKGIIDKQNEMTRLNDMISTNLEKRDVLANANYNAETEFVAELKDKEVESIRTENAVEGIKEEKTRVLEDIVEAERQIMLWEKKIQLERETQAALDPDVGAAESQSMKKEIHRMKLRLDQLKKKQESMLQDMERHILKRETIAVRGKQKSSTGGITTNQLKKKVGDIRSKLTSASQEANALEEKRLRMTQTDANNRNNMTQVQEQVQQLESDADELGKQIGLRAFAKQKNLMDLARTQALEKQLKVIEDGTYQMKLGETELEAEAGKVAEKSAKIEKVIAEISSTFPQFSQELSMVL